MARYTVLTIGEDILRNQAREVTKFDERIEKLLENMLETMNQEDGVGLAAPQIGISKRVIITYKEDEDKVIELINPEILEVEGEAYGQEGCLSVPGKIGRVKRARKIRVRGRNAKGESVEFEAEDMFARILQHEIDHLNGILFVDKAEQVEEIR